MSSAAFRRFEAAKGDVDRLLEIHDLVTGGVQGRHHKLEALNKSIIIMLCACWEAYVEDVTLEATDKLLKVMTGPTQLPDGLRKSLEAEIRETSPERIWTLVGEGWKAVMRDKVVRLCDGLSGGMNTPNSANVSRLIRTALGLNVTTSWFWQNMLQIRAKQKLDELVKDRGALAHGQPLGRAVVKADCYYYLGHVSKLVERTDEAIMRHVRLVKRRLVKAAPAN